MKSGKPPLSEEAATFLRGYNDTVKTMSAILVAEAESYLYLITEEDPS